MPSAWTLEVEHEKSENGTFAGGNNPYWNVNANSIIFVMVSFLIAMSTTQQLRLFFVMLWNVIHHTIVGTIKSCLPSRMLSKKSVKNKVVLITGSASGLGRRMAIEFGKLGARIVLWDINEQMNLDTKQMLDELEIESKAYQVDLSDRKQIYETAERVRKEMDDPDILINNAGIVSGKKLFDCPDDLMEKTMTINCNALFFTTKAFLPSMMERRQGHIVNISSLAGVAGVSGLVDYCASKHGAVGFSEALRSELLSLGQPITVTTVCPFYIDTGMFEGVKTFSPRLFPILDPEYVVDKIVTAVLTDADELFLPWVANLVVAIKGILPTKAANVIGDYFGFNQTMESWKGRTTQKQQIINNGIH